MDSSLVALRQTYMDLNQRESFGQGIKVAFQRQDGERRKTGLTYIPNAHFRMMWKDS